MKIEITATPKEIADLVLVLQGQRIHEITFKCNTITSPEELAKIAEKAAYKVFSATRDAAMI